MEVSYIDHMGTDLSVVNAARVSFNKKHEEFDDDKDTRLINYLARHNHWTPFGHTSVTLHMKLPMFVQRQMDKHQVGFVVNEVSRRYVDDTPEFFNPIWRKRPDASIKQGSGEEFSENEQQRIWFNYGRVVTAAENCYLNMIDEGVAPELARAVLPMSLYTESWKTGSIAAWARVYNLRIDGHAQKEIQDMAKMIDDVIRPLFPVSWEALTN